MKALRIEWIKLDRAANYWLLGILFLIALISGAVHTFGIGSTSGLLLVIFLCINIGSEYSENTLRRSIIEGNSRDEFFRGKLLLMLFATSFAFLLDLVVKVIAVHTGSSAELFTISETINSFVKILASGILAVFLVFVTRSVAISLVLYFVWSVIEALIGSLQQLIQLRFGGNFHLYQYLPLASLNRVLVSNQPMEIQYICLPVLYLLLMLLLPYWLFIKNDIK